MNPLVRAARTAFALVGWPVVALLDRLNGERPVSFGAAMDWAREPVRTVYITHDDPYNEGDVDE